jgi:secreted trypsin-like serine protease
MLPRQYITAFVGKYNLSVTDEPGSVAHSVQEIILHPDWNSESVEFDADISIVVLRDPVEFSRNVEPICLPQQSDVEVVGTGTVVSWDRSEHSEAVGEHYDSTPNELEVPVVSNSHCFLTVKQLFAISSPRTFCAGFINESKAPCSGDSSGGFYLRDSSSKLFNLQGIVVALANDPDEPTRGCDMNMFSLYTNVAKFVDWIKNEIEKSKEIEWKEVEFECKPLGSG